MDEILDYVIIGAGPAGLAFGKTLVENNKNSFVVFDMGKDILDRDRYDSIDSVTGTGGAGLFSDGKFSFYPSGSQVYNLLHIQEAYSAMLQDITRHLNLDTIPTYPSIDYSEDAQNNNWILKSYPSMYMSLDNRINLINNLKNKIGNKLFNNHKVLSWYCVNNLYEVQVLDLLNNKKISILSKNIVCAGGRFQPIDLPVKKIFKRFEFGVRIQGNNNNPAFNSSENLDPKYKYSIDNNTEFRTFCWCKRGEIVKTTFGSNLGKINTYSGRADCSPTNQSNFGLNIIIKNTENYDLTHLQNLININPFTFDLKNVLSNGILITDLYGEQLGTLLILAIKKITEHLPNLLNNCVKILGPTLEGVGYYPQIDNNLKVPNNNIYCIGDCSGTFRGIIASMLSGYELGIRLTK